MKAKLAIVACLLVAFGCFSCRHASTRPEAEIAWSINGTNVKQISLLATNPLKEYTGAITSRVDEFISSFTKAMTKSDLAARVRVAANLKRNLLFASTNSLPELVSASGFLLEFKKEGRLPGVPKDSHGDVNANLAVGRTAALSRQPDISTCDGW
jgi:hypothetical protein